MNLLTKKRQLTTLKIQVLHTSIKLDTNILHTSITVNRNGDKGISKEGWFVTLKPTHISLSGGHRSLPGRN